MDNKRVTVFITKYALTTGILEYPGHTYTKKAVCVYGDFLNGNTFFYGKDFYFTKKEAITRAKEMRGKKIKALRNQISKLQTMVF